MFGKLERTKSDDIDLCRTDHCRAGIDCGAIGSPTLLLEQALEIHRVGQTAPQISQAFQQVSRVKRTSISSLLDGNVAFITGSSRAVDASMSLLWAHQSSSLMPPIPIKRKKEKRIVMNLIVFKEL